MNTHRPDNWVKLKLTLKSGEIAYKLLVGWSGGYLDGDSWRISSDPGEPYLSNGCYIFTTKSGSTYYCHKETQCIRMNTAHILKSLEDHDLVEKVEILDLN